MLYAWLRIFYTPFNRRCYYGNNSIHGRNLWTDNHWLFGPVCYRGQGDCGGRPSIHRLVERRVTNEHNKGLSLRDSSLFFMANQFANFTWVLMRRDEYKFKGD